MKTEPKGTISGLKVTGMIALLASFLLLAPVASAESFSLILYADVDPVLASEGEDVTFTFDVENNGDGTLHDVVVKHFLGTVNEEEIYVGDLGGGVSVDQTAVYTVSEDDITAYKRGRPYIFNEACVMGYDEDGKLLARANAGCTIIVI